MKATLTLILLLALAIATGAQTYVPFPASDALWTIRQGNGEAPAAYFSFGLKNGDTILKGNTYHKLYKSADSVLADSEFYGGIREDSMRRVYFVQPNMFAEVKVYDFSLAIGDTVSMSPGPVGIVRSIDSINIAGQLRRRFNFRLPGGTAWAAGSWIEGIGNSSLGGLLNSPMAQPTCDCAANLICFKQNGVWLYHNPLYATTDCYGPALGFHELPSAPVVTFVPNPVRGMAHIRIAGGHSFSRLVIRNTTGSCSLSYPLTDKHEMTLDATALPAGLYYYSLYDNTGATATGKFVVQ